MSKVVVKCHVCNVEFEREKGELKRSQSKGMYSYCSSKCAYIRINDKKRSVDVERKCLLCGKVFKSSTRRRSAYYCSRSCASKGSVTECRREAQRKSGFKNRSNLIDVQSLLKKKEMWKYEEIKNQLEANGRNFEFEFFLGGRVFDLVLFDSKMIIEFDGKDHLRKGQKSIDIEKDNIASENGFSVKRIVVDSSSVIKSSFIEGL